MRGYNCDMCGKWFTTMEQFGIVREAYDFDYDSGVSHNKIIERPYDLCPKCLQKVVNYIRQEDEK